jgi:hypothetical protein
LRLVLESSLKRISPAINIQISGEL